jgi:hypothetical protein
MDAASAFLLLLAALIINIVVLFAVLRLFTIAKLLQEIRDGINRMSPPPRQEALEEESTKDYWRDKVPPGRDPA